MTEHSAPAPDTAAIPRESSSFWTSIGIGSYLLGLMGAVGLISWLVMAKESIRLDEAQSMWQASHSLSGMLKIVAEDVHVPMYHVLLHYWMILFGSDLHTVRLLSLIFLLLSIPVLYLLARSILTRPWALLVTSLFALSPFMNWYGNEARMYTLLAFFSLLNQYFFVKILQKKKGWFGYGLTAIIGVYSHYFFLFNLFTQALFYLLNRKRFAPGSFKKFILIAAGAALSLAPWVSYFTKLGLGANTRPLLKIPGTVDFFNAFSQFFFGFQPDAVNTIILSSWPLLVIVAFFSVKRHLKINLPSAYLLFAAFVPVLLAYGLSFVISPFFLSRYLVPALAPLFISFAWLLSHYSRRVGIAAAGVWLTVIGVSFYAQMASPLNPVREDYKDAATYITANATPSDVVAITSPFTVYPVEHYYQGPSEIQTLPLWNREERGAIPAFNSQTLPDQVKQMSQGHDYIYLLVSHDQGYEKQIVTYFTNNYERKFIQEYSPDLTLYVFRVGYDTTPRIIET